MQSVVEGVIDEWATTRPERHLMIIWATKSAGSIADSSVKLSNERGCEWEAIAARCAPIVSVASYTGIDPIFKGAAQIWNWNLGERLSEFTTVFDGFGRHSISPNGELYVCANWRKGKNGGVACYNTRTGEKIWHRQDLRQVQGIRFSSTVTRCIAALRPDQSTAWILEAALRWATSGPSMT